MPYLYLLVTVFRSWLLPAATLRLENLALRQQLAVLKRQIQRPRLLYPHVPIWQRAASTFRAAVRSLRAAGRFLKYRRISFSTSASFGSETSSLSLPVRRARGASVVIVRAYPVIGDLEWRFLAVSSHIPSGQGGSIVARATTPANQLNLLK